MKTEIELLEEILAAVKVSPAAAFDALKSGRMSNGYRLTQLTMECPSCHYNYVGRVDNESWLSLTNRYRFTHAPHCASALPVAQDPLWLAKDKLP
jgi:hypothetical protein